MSFHIYLTFNLNSVKLRTIKNIRESKIGKTPKSIEEDKNLYLQFNE